MQWDLFENRQATTPTQSRQASTANKRRALRRLSPTIGKQEQRVLECVRQAGSTGRTREEIAAELEIKEASVCGRVNSLVARGQLFERGTKRNRQGVLYAKGYE